MTQIISFIEQHTKKLSNKHAGTTFEGDRKSADVSTTRTVKGRLNGERRETRRGIQIVLLRGTAERLFVFSPKPL